MESKSNIGLVTAAVGLVAIVAAGCTVRTGSEPAGDAAAGFDGGTRDDDAGALDAGPTPHDGGTGDAAGARDGDTDSSDGDAGWIPGHRLATPDDILLVTCAPEATATCTSERCGCADGAGEECIEEHLSRCAEGRAPVVSGIHVRIDALELCRAAREAAIAQSCSVEVIPSECADLFASAAREGMSCGRLSGAAGFSVSCADGAGRCVASFGAGFSCRRMVARGERCVGPEGEVLPCASGDECVNGTCVAAEGSCRRSADCGGGICVDGRCGRGDGDIGATCASAADCRVGLACDAGTCASRSCDLFQCAGATCCPAGAECAPAEGTTCRPLLREGDACFAGVDPPCGPGLACILESDFSSTCQRPRAEGEPCVVLLDCASGVCLDSVCVAPAQRGERCRDDFECADSLRCIRARCGEGAGVGAACVITDDCAHGLRCVAGDDGAQACRPLPGEGEPCPEFECAEGLFCEGLDEPICVTGGVTCFAATDCEPGFGCIDGACIPCSAACGADEFCTQTTLCTPVFCSADDKL